MTYHTTHHNHCGCGDTLRDRLIDTIAASRSAVSYLTDPDDDVAGETCCDPIDELLTVVQQELERLRFDLSEAGETRDAVAEQRNRIRADRDRQWARADRTEQEQNTERDAAIRRAEAAEAEQMLSDIARDSSDDRGRGSYD